MLLYQFRRTASGYSRADWDDLCDRLRYVPWEEIFKLGISTATIEFCLKKQKILPFPRNLSLMPFGEFSIVWSTKVNFLCLLLFYCLLSLLELI